VRRRKLRTPFYTSRLFRSICKPPTPEDTGWRQYPIVDTWNDLYQRQGLARVGMWTFTRPDISKELIHETYFSILEDCGPVTHWRWKCASR
jgi:hypothetical protein